LVTSIIDFMKGEEMTLQEMIKKYENYKKNYIRMSGRKDLRPYSDSITELYDGVIKDLKSIKK